MMSEASNPLESPPTRPRPRLDVATADSRGALTKKNGTTSWVWGHFRVYQYKQGTAHCDLCGEGKGDLHYKGSTSTLSEHLRSQHRDVYSKQMEKAAAATAATKQSGMSQFVLPGSSRTAQETSVLKFIVDAGVAKGIFALDSSALKT
jgi:hypothetical protein